MIVVTNNTSDSQRIKIGIDYPKDKKCEYRMNWYKINDYYNIVKNI